MGVDSLPGGGRQQPFYRVLVSDRARSNGNGGSSSTNGGGSGGSSNSDAAAASGGASFSDSYSTGGDAAAEADTTAAAAAAAAAFAEVPGPYGAAYPQIWQAEGFGSQLRGLHNRPRAEVRTYVRARARVCVCVCACVCIQRVRIGMVEWSSSSGRERKDELRQRDISHGPHAPAHSHTASSSRAPRVIRPTRHYVAPGCRKRMLLKSMCSSSFPCRRRHQPPPPWLHRHVPV
ncbi:hypothetical protein Vretifemale_3703 [Volvox reticuliferus]|nr:hypothetical protein Vretifemale_3703 [Volvox reticuliferus]